MRAELGPPRASQGQAVLEAEDERRTPLSTEENQPLTGWMRERDLLCLCSNTAQQVVNQTLSLDLDLQRSKVS